VSLCLAARLVLPILFSLKSFAFLLSAQFSFVSQHLVATQAKAKAKNWNGSHWWWSNQPCLPDVMLVHQILLDDPFQCLRQKEPFGWTRQCWILERLLFGAVPNNDERFCSAILGRSHDFWSMASLKGLHCCFKKIGLMVSYMVKLQRTIKVGQKNHWCPVIPHHTL
jgi:hypothetical protein